MDLFKAHCSVKGWIFQYLLWGGISADSSPSAGAGGGISDDPSPMMIELEIKLPQYLCTSLYMTGVGESSRVSEKEEENMSVFNRSNLLNCQLYMNDIIE